MRVMLGHRLNIYWKVCWMLLSPAIITVSPQRMSDQNIEVVGTAIKMPDPILDCESELKREREAILVCVILPNV